MLANRSVSRTLDSAPATKAAAPLVQWSTVKVVVKAGSYEPVLKRTLPALYKAAKQLLAVASSAEQVAALCSVLMSSSGHKAKLDRALAIERKAAEAARAETRELRQKLEQLEQQAVQAAGA